MASKVVGGVAALSLVIGAVIVPTLAPSARADTQFGFGTRDCRLAASQPDAQGNVTVTFTGSPDPTERNFFAWVLFPSLGPLPAAAVPFSGGSVTKSFAPGAQVYAQVAYVRTFPFERYLDVCNAGGTVPKAVPTLDLAGPAGAEVGTPVTYSATIGAPSTGGSVAWSSKTTGVCTVSATGEVTPVSAGDCTITASFAGDSTSEAVSTDAHITVTAPPPAAAFGSCTVSVAKGKAPDYLSLATVTWTTSPPASLVDVAWSGAAAGSAPDVVATVGRAETQIAASAKGANVTATLTGYTKLANGAKRQDATTTCTTPWVAPVVPASAKPAAAAPVPAPVWTPAPSTPSAIPGQQPPATTGGGGASSASGGTGGSGAVAAISAPCLADTGLYASMAGSVGSSFVMAPNLRNREIPASFALTSGSLPPGISVDGAAGVVFGVPTAVAAAQSVTITATYANGTTEDSTFTFSVDDPHHSVAYPERIIGGLGEPLQVFHHSTGNSGPTSYALVCGVMPEGLSLDPTRGIISGTPTTLVSYPVPLRVRMTDDHGWVDSSMMLLVGSAANPWLSYPAHVYLAQGAERTVRPSASAVPGETFELLGRLPEGMTFSTTDGSFTGRPAKAISQPRVITVQTVLPDGSVAASDTFLLTVRKRAVPMRVTAQVASATLKPARRATVVSHVKHTQASRLTAKVVCADCTHTFDATTGRVTVRPGADTTSVRVTVTATPVGSAARAKYRPHAWTRTWSVR